MLVILICIHYPKAERIYPSQEFLMRDAPVVDIAGHLPSDLTQRQDLWPAGPQTSGGHVTPYDLAAFASRSEYVQPVRITVKDSAERLHLSVWLHDGPAVESDARKFRVRGRDTVAGYLPGVPLKSHFHGKLHHVGLLLAPGQLPALGGEQGEAFFDRLRRDDCLRVQPGSAEVLRAAHELDAILIHPSSSPLLREAKSLELLAHLLSAGDRRDTQASFTPAQRERLRHARELLLADLAGPPTIEQLARASGINAFALKQGFKRLFGLPVHALYQQERMRAAWQLIASGQASVSEAGARLGYTNMSHFGTAFRKAFGVLPGELRKR